MGQSISSIYFLLVGPKPDDLNCSLGWSFWLPFVFVDGVAEAGKRLEVLGFNIGPVGLGDGTRRSWKNALAGYMEQRPYSRLDRIYKESHKLEGKADGWINKRRISGV